MNVDELRIIKVNIGAAIFRDEHAIAGLEPIDSAHFVGAEILPLFFSDYNAAKSNSFFRIAPNESSVRHAIPFFAPEWCYFGNFLAHPVDQPRCVIVFLLLSSRLPHRISPGLVKRARLVASARPLLV